MRASILLPEREQPDRIIGRECGRRRAKLFKMRGNPFAARMAKLADAADLKSAEVYPSWGFKSPSGHQRARALNALHVNGSLQNGSAGSRSELAVVALPA